MATLGTKDSWRMTGSLETWEQGAWQVREHRRHSSRPPVWHPGAHAPSCQSPNAELDTHQRWLFCSHAYSQLFLLLWLCNVIVSQLVKCKYKKGRIMVSTKISTRYYKGLERWLANRHIGMPILTSLSPKWKLLSKTLKCFNAFWNSSSLTPNLGITNYNSSWKTQALSEKGRKSINSTSDPFEKI